MSEFCVKCCEHEATIELLRKQLYETQQKNKELESDIESLAIDIAFYDGSIKIKGHSNE